MKIAELVLRYIQTLVWPAMVLATLLVVRPHIESFFQRMRVGEVDAFGVKVRAELDEVLEFVVSKAPTSTGRANVEETRLREEFDRLLSEMDYPIKYLPDPELEINYAFNGLIKIVGRCASLFGLESSREEIQRVVKGEIGGSVAIELRKLKASGIIEDDLLKAAISLAVLGYVLSTKELNLSDGTIPAFKDTVDAEMARGYKNAVVGTSQILITKVLEAFVKGDGAIPKVEK